MKSSDKIFPIVFFVHLAVIIYSIALAQIFYFLLLCVWVAVIFKNKEISFNSYDILFLVFILLRIVTIIASEYPSLSVIAIYREIIFYPYYFIAVYYFRSKGIDGIKTALWVSLFAAIIPSLYAIWSVAQGAVGRGASFSGGYSVFAVHTSFMFAFGLALFVTQKKPKIKLMVTAGLLIYAAGVVSTYTRAMWIAVVLCVLALGIIGYRKTLIAFALVGIAAFSFFSSVHERFLSLLDPMHSSSGRLELWNAGLELVSRHMVLGFGPETLRAIIGDRSRFFDPYINSWHNEILHVTIESGIIAPLLLLTIYGFSFFLLFKLKRPESLENNNGQFEFYFILFTILIIIPSIMFGSIMLSILNGLVLKFVLAFYSFTGEESEILKRRTWRFRS